MGPPSHKFPIQFLYFKRFSWEWYGSSIGKGVVLFRPLEFPMIDSTNMAFTNLAAIWIIRRPESACSSNNLMQNPNRSVKTKSKIQNPKSKIQNPKSKIQNPKSKIQNPKSEIQNPKSKIQNPRSKIQNPKSKIQDPKSKIQNPNGRVWGWHKKNGYYDNPKSKIQNPRSKIQNPKSKLQTPKSKIQTGRLDFGFWSLDLGGRAGVAMQQTLLYGWAGHPNVA